MHNYVFIICILPKRTIEEQRLKNKIGQTSNPKQQTVLLIAKIPKHDLKPNSLLCS